MKHITIRDLNQAVMLHPTDEYNQNQVKRLYDMAVRLLNENRRLKKNSKVAKAEAKTALLKERTAHAIAVLRGQCDEDYWEGRE